MSLMAVETAGEGSDAYAWAGLHKGERRGLKHATPLIREMWLGCRLGVQSVSEPRSREKWRIKAFTMTKDVWDDIIGEDAQGERPTGEVDG